MTNVIETKHGSFTVEDVRFDCLAIGDRFVQFVGGDEVHAIYRVTAADFGSIDVYDEVMTDEQAAALRSMPGFEAGTDPREGTFGYLPYTKMQRIVP